MGTYEKTENMEGTIYRHGCTVTSKSTWRLEFNQASTSTGKMKIERSIYRWVIVTSDM